MNSSYSFRLALSLMLTGMICSVSFSSAVNAQTFPAQSDPGLQMPGPSDVEREEQQRKEQKAIPTEDQAPKIEIETPQTSPSVQIQAPSFKVDTIQVEGSTLFGAADFAAITSPYQGQEATLNDLEKVVEQINKLYWEKGYLTTQAYVPPQDVDKGTVTIKVVEGRLGKICVSENKHYRTKSILKRLSVEEGQLFNIKQLEKDLNWSNQNNNYRLKATLSPGTSTGETNVTLEVAERQPWQISPTFDNQGRPFIGTYRGGVELSNDSLLGFGDRLFAKYLGASGTNTALGSYFIPINKWGDELGFSYGWSHVDVDLNVPAQPDIDGIAHSGGIVYSHPFDKRRMWVGDIGINARRIRTFIADTRTSLDEIRSAQVGLSFNRPDHLGRTFARVQTSLGLDIFGGNSQFWKTEAMFTRIHQLPWDNTLILRGYGQLTPDDLPSAEAFQVGGAYSVRGYSEGLFVGDRGYNFTIEDRFPIPFLSHVSPWLADRLQGAVFFDIGQTFLDRDNARFVPGVSNRSSNTLLLGTGFGLRARLTQYLQGFIDVGFGLVDRSAAAFPNGDPTARIHFGIRSDLLPEDLKKRGNKKECVNAAAIELQTPAAEKEAVSPRSEDEPPVLQQQSQAPVQNEIKLAQEKAVSGNIGVMSILNSH